MTQVFSTQLFGVWFSHFKPIPRVDLQVFIEICEALKVFIISSLILYFLPFDQEEKVAVFCA